MDNVNDQISDDMMRNVKEYDMVFDTRQICCSTFKQIAFSHSYECMAYVWFLDCMILLITL